MRRLIELLAFALLALAVAIPLVAAERSTSVGERRLPAFPATAD